ncbi:hypothetical protein FBQ99_18520 [Chloroflexi bacterium CFX2]|nr:hypothetical protein [Chloroflexi bacterium CFX2]
MTKDKGLIVFMNKNAEAEPWLIPHAFVPPPDFEFFKGSTSSLIYAKSGMGKTAVSCALAEYARSQLKCLPVQWTPDLTFNPQAPSTELANAQFSSVLSACAHEILRELPKDFKKRAKDNRNFDFIAEFLHHFTPKQDNELLIEKIPISKSFLIGRDTKLEVIATELIKSMQFVGFPGGIWIMVDGLTWNLDVQKQIVINVLRSILSTLSVFEIPNFHFKMFLPLELERELVENPARVKERVTTFRIAWEAKRLRAMIEKRLRLALDNEQVHADHIYSAEELFTWLEACGGLSPRGWLEYFRPIFATVWENYELEGILRRLEKNEWVTARKRSSLQLRFYPDNSQIVIGMNSPRTLSQEELAIFSYLYKNEGRYCSKREIYNKAYLPFNTKGRGKELGPQDELTKEYDDLVNTAIHRLRKTIEPLPKNPVFLTMKKNLGYRLSLQAFLDE